MIVWHIHTVLGDSPLASNDEEGWSRSIGRIDASFRGSIAGRR